MNAEAHVVKVTRSSGVRLATLRVGPAPVFTEMEFADLTPEVYDDLRAALCGGKMVVITYAPGPPATISGVSIRA